MNFVLVGFCIVEEFLVVFFFFFFVLKKETLIFRLKTNLE